jgi:hypothetical protein
MGRQAVRIPGGYQVAMETVIGLPPWNTTPPMPLDTLGPEPAYQ